MPDLDDIDVIAPNLNRRLSGVTATVIALVPLQAKKTGIAATGVALPDGLPFVPLWKLPFLKRKPRVWHARRNNEMLLGILLRSVLRMKLKMIFTSSSPRIRGGLTNWMVSKMDAIVATTPVNAGVMPGTPVIIPHGVNTETFSPGPSDIFDVPNQKLIGCFGRVRQMKGTHHFVDAMCSLLPDHPEYTAVIMGRITPDNAAYGADLKKRIADAGLADRILFKDELPLTEMPKAYRALSLYVAPSLLEGFGLTPLEALSCEVPVVATDVGAFRDFVSQDCGIIVDKDDAPALTAAVGTMLAKDLPAMGQAGRNRVSAEFGLEREADALVALYRDLLAK
ncbi:glycosyltransferase family 4 protein [Shimia thalassica]|uniref:glycosyltransferase family 4 protein n=1 Tax=Shimia thalassica TaxID=1715693 RepID=UPI0027354885|nr:glycosyltransferase family 4 protein [Shimia thalassica]MDP2493498.1 glycosyltransferase family 4 protein [Shimia thalassica]